MSIGSVHCFFLRVGVRGLKNKKYIFRSLHCKNTYPPTPKKNPSSRVSSYTLHPFHCTSRYLIALHLTTQTKHIPQILCRLPPLRTWITHDGKQETEAPAVTPVCFPHGEGVTLLRLPAPSATCSPPCPLIPPSFDKSSSLKDGFPRPQSARHV